MHRVREGEAVAGHRTFPEEAEVVEDHPYLAGVEAGEGVLLLGEVEVGEEAGDHPFLVVAVEAEEGVGLPFLGVEVEAVAAVALVLLARCLHSQRTAF